MPAHRTKKKLVFSALGVLLGVVLVYQWWTGSPSKGVVTHVEADYGAYTALIPAQQRLVDDWVARFGKASGKSVVAADLYNGLPLSMRTTFTAVTHALSHTNLTDRDGAPMGLTALDLIAKIDAVAGSYPQKGGDQQFRIYVQVRPDAMRTLGRSRQFARQVDNTIYHKGYPICFRGTGGTPSIQFSLSRDAMHGDIDVDYRSSSFPIMLIDGHLTASNSDVRAGNNDERHNGHWAGLRNWWRGLMGLPLGDAARAENVTITGAVSTEPRLGKGTKPEEAIADFLSAWLVEQKPEVAVGYIAPRAFACAEDEGVPVDRGMARLQLARVMTKVNERIGRVLRLADATSAVALSGERGREISQAHHDAFAMYDIREDLAAAIDCNNRLHPDLADAKQAQSTKFGKYVAAVFRVRAGHITGESVATIWAQDNGRWMLISYAVEPEFKPGDLPNAPEPQVDRPEARSAAVPGNEAMNRAAKAFFEAWFVQNDPSAAFGYLSSSSYVCADLYRPEDAPDTASAKDSAKLIQDRMRIVRDYAGATARLEDVLAPVEPQHSDVRLVKHEESAAFAIIAVPDSLGAAQDCTRMSRGESPRYDATVARTYGRFYVTSSRLRRAGPDAAVLWTVWGRENRAWKIVAFRVVAP